MSSSIPKLVTWHEEKRQNAKTKWNRSTVTSQMRLININQKHHHKGNCSQQQLHTSNNHLLKSRWSVRGERPYQCCSPTRLGGCERCHTIFCKQLPIIGFQNAAKPFHESWPAALGEAWHLLGLVWFTPQLCGTSLLQPSCLSLRPFCFSACNSLQPLVCFWTSVAKNSNFLAQRKE